MPLFLAAMVVEGVWGCAVVSPERSGGREGQRSGSRAFVGVDATTPGTAADSLDGFEESLSREGEALENDRVAQIADELQAVLTSGDGGGTGESPGIVSDRGRSAGSRRAFARLEGLTGRREVFTVSAGTGRRVRGGVRRSGGATNGYVELTGDGAIRRLVVGGLRPRLGEGLLLGARYSLFGPPRMTRQGAGFAAGVAVSPTLSTWNIRRGAAGTIALGNNRISVAGWREDGPSGSGGDDVYWVSAARRDAGGVVGAAAGTRTARPGGEGNSAPGAVDAAVFAGRETPYGSVSAEVARCRGRTFAAARSTVKTEADWNLELISGPVPSGFSNTVIGPEDLCQRHWGGAVHRLRSYRRLRTRVSLYSNAYRSESKAKRRRRLDFEGSGRDDTGGFWQASLRLAETSTTTLSTNAVEHASTPNVWRQGRCRLLWRSADERGLQQHYGLLLLIGGGEPDTDRAGYVGTVELGFNLGAFDARFRVNNYALAPGQVGYVTRPGIAGYESVSIVGGTGSDLSSRIRWRLAGRGLLTLFWGQPWQKAPRWYAGLKVTL